MNKQKAVVFGLGNSFFSSKELIYNEFDVIALVDNDAAKIGMIIDSKEVQHPSVLKKIVFDVVVVTTERRNADEMRSQLESMGIYSNQLRSFRSGGIASWSISPRFFDTNLDYESKRTLFAQNMERVIIEINSKCNRRCWFCTNSIIDGHQKNIDMSDATFDKIMSDLRSINYAEEIVLSFFNEPLLCGKLFDRIAAIKQACPDSFLHIFTNGDFLTIEITEQLSKYVNLLSIDFYENENNQNSEWDLLSKKAIIAERAETLRMKSVIYLDMGVYTVNAFSSIGEMNVEFISRDFRQMGSNRAESLPNDLPIPKITEHLHMCIKDFISYHIDYSGNVWPCPDYHHGFLEHKQYIVGNVLEDNLFDIYLGPKIQEYRMKRMFHREVLPCRSCIWDFHTFIQNMLNRPFRDRPLRNRNESAL